MIEFSKRAKVTTTDVARIRRWRSLNSPLAILHVRSLFGLPPKFLLVQQQGKGEQIVSRHRSKEAAERAAQKVTA